MIAVLWAYEGWHYTTFAAGEAVDPQRTFPRAITVATATLIVTYLIASYGYVAALGPSAAAASEHVAADAASAVLGRTVGSMVGALILVSIFSATNGLMFSAPRMFYAMARDRVFFARLGVLSERTGTPATAIVVTAVWSAILAVSGTFTQLLTYVVFTGWIFYGLGALAVIVLRRRDPDAERAFKVPAYPFTPLLFVASALVLVLNTMLSQPTRAAIGIGAVLLGVPVFFFWRPAASRAATASPMPMEE
jgi:APA family basic amino acid/polyamine antiporter